MQGNGIISVKSISKIFRKLFAFLIRMRSTESLITDKQRIDTISVMEMNELGRDNMEEFAKIVPDECLIELSDKVYCNN